MATFTTSRRVEFADVDVNGIVHFARFFVYVETAEHEMLRASGGDVHMRIDGTELTWPRVEAHCDYRAPARLGDLLDIELEVDRIHRSSVSYRFEVRRRDDRLAAGRMTVVCCARDEGELVPVPVPQRLAASLTGIDDR